MAREHRAHDARTAGWRAEPVVAALPGGLRHPQQHHPTRWHQHTARRTIERWWPAGAKRPGCTRSTDDHWWYRRRRDRNRFYYFTDNEVSWRGKVCDTQTLITNSTTLDTNDDVFINLNEEVNRVSRKNKKKKRKKKTRSAVELRLQRITT